MMKKMTIMTVIITNLMIMSIRDSDYALMLRCRDDGDKNQDDKNEW